MKGSKTVTFPTANHESPPVRGTGVAIWSDNQGSKWCDIKTLFNHWAVVTYFGVLSGLGGKLILFLISGEYYE